VIDRDFLDSSLSFHYLRLVEMLKMLMDYPSLNLNFYINAGGPFIKYSNLRPKELWFYGSASYL